VTDLAKVSERRYNLAMAVVMGRDLDAVICDTRATAQECIAWLRAQMIAPITFFPLDTVRPKVQPLSCAARMHVKSSTLWQGLICSEVKEQEVPSAAPPGTCSAESAVLMQLEAGSLLASHVGCAQHRCRRKANRGSTIAAHSVVARRCGPNTSF
jgi:hypothetical protein